MAYTPQEKVIVAISKLEEMDDTWTATDLYQWLELEDQESKTALSGTLNLLKKKGDIFRAVTKKRYPPTATAKAKSIFQYSTKMAAIAAVDGNGKDDIEKKNADDKTDADVNSENADLESADQTPEPGYTFEELGKGVYQYAKQLEGIIKGLQNQLSDSNEVIQFHEQTIEKLNSRIVVLNKQSKGLKGSSNKVKLSEVATFT